MRKREWIQAVAFLFICSLLIANCVPGKSVTAPGCIKRNFETFPDGTHITGDTTDSTIIWQNLNGDEFSEWGFLVDSTSIAGCAIIRTSYYVNENNHLAIGNSGSCINSDKIKITFIEPIREITLSFLGATTNYRMEVYDESGEFLGVANQMAEFDNGETLFYVSYRSDEANISAIQFGDQLGTADIAIQEIKMCD